MTSQRNCTYKDQRLKDAFGGSCRLVADGAMGSLLMQQGLLEGGALSELLCLSNPAAITAIHRSYVEAGAQIITTNTFCANGLKLKGLATVAEVYAAAAQCARDAGAPYVGADIGPLGQLLDPYGDLEEEEAATLFDECTQAAVAAGCDLIMIETMTCLEEALLAVEAAARTNLPIVATMSFAQGGRTMFGTTPEQAAQELAAAGAGIVGTNCSLGPDQMVDVVTRMAEAAEVPVLAQPNAGLPRVENGETVYDISAPEFAQAAKALLEAGAAHIGSCCGSTPAFTEELAKLS